MSAFEWMLLSSKSVASEVYIYQNACYNLSTHQEKKFQYLPMQILITFSMSNL